MSSSSDQGERAGRSCPSTGHADLGVVKLNDALRSVLMNPTALALFGALHRDSLGRSAVKQIEHYTGALPHLETNRKDWEKVLITAIDEVKPEVKPDVTTSSVATSNSKLKKKQKTRIGETALTRELNALLQGRLPKIEVQNEWHVKSERESKHGALDLTFYDKSMFKKKAGKAEGSTSKVKAYGVVEFGVVSGSKDLETLFFEKLCQGLIYLELLGDGRLRGNSTIGTPRAVPSVEGEMILSVVALSETCERGLFATFLCEPRDVDASKWRVCLLSKNVSVTTEESSRAFADMLSVINAIKGFNRPTSWKYLGPNCSKVGNRGQAKVLRAYDTRVRPTHRSPEMYLQLGKVVDECTTLFTYQEGRTPILDFRQGSRQGDQYVMVDRFFKLQGKLQIIAIPFIEGTPAYRNGTQAVNLITELEELHDEDIVHGDIRGWNSLHASTYSKFIDFDYSGTAGQVWYPRGFVSKLEDGKRTKIRSLPIEKNQDVYALGQLLLKYHDLDVDALEEQDRKTAVPKWDLAVGKFMRKLERIERATKENGKELLKDMKVFFRGMSTYPFRAVEKWDAPDTIGTSKITQKGCAVSPEFHQIDKEDY